MVKEIVSIQLGQCGNQVGLKFWETISKEHGIKNDGTAEGASPEQLESVGMYFERNSACKYIPRCILIDLDPSSKDSILSQPIGQLFNPDNFVMGKNSVGNNWARGHNTEGAQLLPDILTVVKKEAEKCSSLHGFQVIHGIGGGTGSGLGALLIQKLRDDYSDKTITTFTVFPSSKMSDTVVECYNATLTIGVLMEKVNETFCFDNEAMYGIGQRVYGLQKPSFEEVNHWIALAMSGITSGLRFSSSSQDNVQKTLGPLLHFYIPGFAPLAGNELNVEELIKRVCKSSNMMVACDPVKGKYLGADVIFRGELEMKEITDKMASTPGVPKNAKASLCKTPPAGLMAAATLVANSTAIQEMFKRISGEFSELFNRKAFLQWYLEKGMDETDFTKAHKKLEGLIQEYQKHHNTLDQ
ncbi:hypothetical protein CAEBREN_29511 [Caenorhabditis brenneri]|uniref:Tubulin beta chain n=1 Tax=Caenorhabditis brenneri TaxID=135651 RepID=G0NJB4_CAEBE|nr:hypothetical protein CAEBREN_29511 [Caenorhabditis brenneri]